VCSRALAEYVARHAPDRVTEAMDRAPEDIGEMEAIPMDVIPWVGARGEFLERRRWSRGRGEVQLGFGSGRWRCGISRKGGHRKAMVPVVARRDPCGHRRAWAPCGFAKRAHLRRKPAA
jgi:hypothetical protein